MSSILILGLFILAFYLADDLTYEFFIPTSLPQLAELESYWPYTSFILAMLAFLLGGLIWNSRMVQAEVLIVEDYSQVYNFLMMGAIIYFSCPSLLLALGFLCITLSLNRIFSINKNTDTAYSNCFDAGLFVGMASFLVFPFILFLPFIWLSVLNLKNLGFKELLWSIIGFCSPYFILFMLSILFDWNLDLLPSAFLSDLNFETHKNSELIIFYCLSLLACLLGYFILSKEINKSSIRFKVTMNTLMVFFIFNLVFTSILVGLNGFSTIVIFFFFLMPFFWHCVQSSRKRYVLKTLFYVCWVLSILNVILR
ncbi:MAG: hypothetical protein AAF487_01925 [Bacteroidota bacterium]